MANISYLVEEMLVMIYVCIWMIVTICPDLASCEAQIQSHPSFMSIRLQFSSMMEPALDELS